MDGLEPHSHIYSWDMTRAAAGMSTGYPAGSGRGVPGVVGYGVPGGCTTGVLPGTLPVPIFNHILAQGPTYGQIKLILEVS